MVETVETVLKALADNMDNRASLDVGSQASGEAGSQDSVSSSVAIVPFSTAIVKYTPPPPPTSTEPLTSPVQDVSGSFFGSDHFWGVPCDIVAAMTACHGFKAESSSEEEDEAVFDKANMFVYVRC